MVRAQFLVGVNDRGEVASATLTPYKSHADNAKIVGKAKADLLAFFGPGVGVSFHIVEAMLPIPEAVPGIVPGSVISEA